MKERKQKKKLNGGVLLFSFFNICCDEEIIIKQKTKIGYIKLMNVKNLNLGLYDRSD